MIFTKLKFPDKTNIKSEMFCDQYYRASFPPVSHFIQSEKHLSDLKGQKNTFLKNLKSLIISESAKCGLRFESYPLHISCIRDALQLLLSWIFQFQNFFKPFYDSFMKGKLGGFLRF